MSHPGDTTNPWLADIAANVLCVVLIVLVLAAMMPRSPLQPVLGLTLTDTAPESAATMVEALRQRLIGTDHALFDLTERGVDPIRNVPGPALVFVFSPRHHAALADRFQSDQRSWRDITVPQALQGADGGFSAEFLALAARADTPERFRADLIRLLVRGPMPLVLDAAPPSSLAARLVVWGQLLLASCAAVLVLGVYWVGRRAALKS